MMHRHRMHSKSGARKRKHGKSGELKSSENSHEVVREARALLPASTLSAAFPRE
jgi:hypothetical protein